MRRHSLRLRLLAAAAVAVAAAVVVAGFGLVTLFERHVERRIDGELDTFIRQLAGSVVFQEDGAAAIKAPLGDPRFAQAYGGLYWQIEDGKDGAVLRSRSLWDFKLALPADAVGPGAVHRHLLSGPQDSRLIVRERSVIYATPAGERPLRIAVALDSRDLTQARESFAGDIMPSLALLAVVLLAAIWVQVGYGLRPLEAIRRGINAVRAGEASRLDADHPVEVQPLVREVNDLLAAQEKAMAEARARAADLAHGLKTPLTVLAQDARRVADMGAPELAAELGELAESMRRHVERELVRSRLGTVRGTPRQRVAAAAIADRLVRILKRTPRGETLAWAVEAAEDAIAAVDAEDLTELLGNLLDNACKWASGAVRVTARVDGAEVCVRIEDDGPGVPEDKRPTLGQRGLRLDQSVQGSGQGLAIVKEIVAAYGGSLRFAERDGGGLAAEVRLPAARSEPI